MICKPGQVISMSIDYFNTGGGGGGGTGSLDISFFFVVCFSLKISLEGHIIYRIVNCVSVI